MKSILWTQSAKVTDEDTFVFDGLQKKLYSGLPEEDSAMKLFSDARKWNQYKPINIDKKKKKGLIRKSLCITQQEGKSFFISSCFTDKDEKDRYICFMFYCETASLSEALDELRKASIVAERSVNENEFNALLEVERERERKSDFLKKITSVKGLLVIGCSILFAICTLYIFSSTSTSGHSNSNQKDTTVNDTIINN